MKLQEYQFGHRTEEAWEIFKKVQNKSPDKLRVWVRWTNDATLLAFIDCFLESSGLMSDIDEYGVKKQEYMELIGNTIPYRTPLDPFLHNLASILICSTEFPDRPLFAQKILECLENDGTLSSEFIRRFMVLPLQFDARTSKGELAMKYLLYKDIIEKLEEKNQLFWRNLWWDKIESFYNDGLANSTDET